MSEQTEFVDDGMRLSRRYSMRVVAAVGLIGLLAVAFMLPVPYVVERPGPAFNTLGDFEGKPMLTFGKGVKTFPTDGSLDFTTVSVTRPENNISLLSAAKAYFTADTAVVPRSLVYPEGTTNQQSTAESAAQLDGSKDSSKVAALRAAGYTVTGTPVVAAVTKGGAAAGKLKVDDEITSIDGTKVTSSQEAVAAVSKRTPGDDVTVGYTRDGKTATVTLATRPAEDDPKLPRIGVALGTTFDFPLKIDNNVGKSIGGPSAGTMFALAIYDKLTPGALTGGLKVAGTGEMAVDGTVGPIGGVQQKISGAHRAGARIFLVPAANCAEAVDGDTHGLKLVEIKTLDGAIDALEKLAKDRKAEVPTCS